MMKRKLGRFTAALAVLGALTMVAAAQETQPPAPSAPPAKASQPAQSAAAPQQAPASAAAANAPKSGETAAKPPEFPPDSVVMKVGGAPVTVADLDFAMHLLPPQVQSQVMLQGRKPMGDQYSLLMALSQKASRQHLDQAPNFQRQMNLARMQYLANEEYKSIADATKVTPDDVKEYFDAHQSDYAALEIRQVSIRKKVGNAAGGAPGLPEQEAKAKADEIRKAIESGTDFSKIADQFKMPGIIFFDAQPRAVRHGQLPPNLDQAVFKLKDGEISETTENPQVLYFMQVVKHTQSELKDVEREVEDKLKNEKTQAALDNVKKEASVWMDPAYFAPHTPPAPAPQEAPAPAAPSGDKSPH